MGGEKRTESSARETYKTFGEKLPPCQDPRRPLQREGRGRRPECCSVSRAARGPFLFPRSGPAALIRLETPERRGAQACRFCGIGGAVLFLQGRRSRETFFRMPHEGAGRDGRSRKTGAAGAMDGEGGEDEKGNHVRKTWFPLMLMSGRMARRRWRDRRVSEAAASRVTGERADCGFRGRG